MIADYNEEAKKITWYLISAPLQDEEALRYVEAMSLLKIELNHYESILFSNMLENKWRMASIDAALALKDPNNNVRRKLFVMLAILEASPNYTKYFLARDFSVFYYFRLILISFRSVIRAILGLIILYKIKKKCN
ncbi:hypothetical protein [uncultured Aquimarina sp.]|uniref:hypothetical protein n=1 Tax=uncultured Aquimarina sp. TaxID=575652 RepID=UPI00261A6A82|nr:hypothetical protein [uncultured Aquimarina sp.]